MDALRRPFLVVALLALSALVALEIGSTALISPGPATGEALAGALDGLGAEAGDVTAALSQGRQAGTDGDPPGLAIPSLALIDGLLLVTMLGLGLAIVVPHRILARVVAPANLVISLLTVLIGIRLFVTTLALLFLMLGLFLAAPFGTVAYLARWGAFPRPGAQGMLAAILALKLVFCGFAIAASPRLIGQKGLVALVATSIVVQLMIGYLHGLVPLPLVSMLDAVAALIVIAVAIVWAVVIMAGSTAGTLRLARLRLRA